MKIVITGSQYEQVLEPANEAELQSLTTRSQLDLELWNRDNPSDQRQMQVVEQWPLPAPEED